jgi:Flp pilus assembly protein TadD
LISTREILDDAKVLFRQGVDKSRQGHYAEAIQDFDQAVQCDPDDADAYGHRCVARHRTGNRQGAIADCEKAAALYLKQERAKEHQYALKMLRKLQM